MSKAQQGSAEHAMLFKNPPVQHLSHGHSTSTVQSGMCQASYKSQQAFVPRQDSQALISTSVCIEAGLMQQRKGKSVREKRGFVVQSIRNCSLKIGCHCEDHELMRLGYGTDQILWTCYPPYLDSKHTASSHTFIALCTCRAIGMHSATSMNSFSLLYVTALLQT